MSTTEDRGERQIYELGYLILPSLNEESLSQAVSAIKEIVKKSGGEELDSEDPLKINLAYTMSKTIGARKYVVDEAFIGWVKFETEGTNIAEIQEAVKNLEEVLRFIVVKAPRETTFTFSAAIKAKEERERARREALAEESSEETSLSEGDKEETTPESL